MCVCVCVCVCVVTHRSLTNVVAHEIAHSWTGNLVTNDTWQDFWCNEGFTMFLERKILRKLRGEQTFQVCVCVCVCVCVLVFARDSPFVSHAHSFDVARSAPTRDR